MTLKSLIMILSPRNLLGITLLLALLVGNIDKTQAQVTIGVAEAPVSGALLQLKEISNVNNGEINATGGLLLPRVKLTKRDQLYPMFSSDLNYIPNKSNIDLQHAGLLVMNIEENIDEILCFGVNIWDGAKWNCLRTNTNYTIDCNTVEVKGVYKKDQSLNSGTHYIELDLIAEDRALNAIYHVKTNTIDGIYFEGKGKLVAGKQTIVLQGHGTPASYDTKSFSITSNSESLKSTCSAEVVMTIPGKGILVLGNNVDHGYNISLSGTGSNKLLTSLNNFGTEEYSIINYEGTNFLNGKTVSKISFPSSYGTLPSPSEITNITKALLTDKIVDILVITQDVYITDASLIQAIADYLEADGVVVAFWEANSGASALMNKIFKTTAITDVSINAAGAVYKIIATNEKDPILNGPFGNVINKQWGEDASLTRGLSNVPTDQIDTYSMGSDISGTTSPANASGMITAFKHKSLNFLWFGDGGFVSSGTNGAPASSPTICPLWWDTTTMFPLQKTTYGRGSNHSVYNSIIYLNTMAWAIDRAQFHGINKN